MTNWRSFEDAEPDLARRAHAILSATTNAVLGTLRADGSPRLSGIDPWFWNGDLWFGSMGGARKAADLHRDPRMALHAVPWESRRPREGSDGGGDGDAKLTGRAIAVTDPEVVTAVMAALAAERGFEPPSDDGDLFRVDVASVVVISVEHDQLVIDRWSERDGRHVVRRD
jgi:hypothetical protein